MELVSEFGHVQVELDNSANGARLMIKDLKSGQTIFLDPLELTWDQFVALVGEESAEFLFAEAVTDANENGEF